MHLIGITMWRFFGPSYICWHY